MKKCNFTKVTSCPICDIVTEPNDVYSLIQHAITDFKHFGLEINPFVCTIITCGVTKIILEPIIIIIIM